MQQQAVAYFPDNQEGGVAGYVIFENSANKSCIVRAYFSKLPPGDHGFHIHKAGDLRGEGCHGACDHYHVGPPSDHGGPTGKRRHTGDLGNISTKAGPFYKSYELEGVTVEDLYGRSVIVHADPDDLGKGPHEDSKTTGHSGKRIACAIIGRATGSAAASSKRTTLKAPKHK
jgi:Cu-Zn family superoxide dismutase